MKQGRIRPFFSPFGVTQLIMVAAVGTALYLAYGPWRLQRAREEIRNRYPNVSRINQDSLTARIKDRQGRRMILIDTRPKDEFDFSRLPGALRMAPSETPAALGFSETAGVDFVIYDAFGADACAVAASLTERGYKQVQALEGGIFDWANNGMVLEGPGGPAGKVKPGSSRYSNLLRRSHRGP